MYLNLNIIVATLDSQSANYNGCFQILLVDIAISLFKNNNNKEKKSRKKASLVSYIPGDSKPGNVSSSFPFC